MNLRPSAVCICVYEQKYVAKHKKEEEKQTQENRKQTWRKQNQMDRIDEHMMLAC